MDASRDLDAAEWRKRGCRARQNGGKLWAVPQDDAGHPVLVDPIEPERRIDFRAIVDREEAIALQPPRRHEDEDTERGVAEAEAFRRRLRMQANHRVDVLDVFVEVLDPADGVLIGRELLPV